MDKILTVMIILLILSFIAKIFKMSLKILVFIVIGLILLKMFL